MQIKKKHTHASDEHRTRPVAVKFYLTDDEAYRFDKLAADLGLTTYDQEGEVLSFSPSSCIAC